MAHPPFLREKARQLRVSKQLTIDQLAAQLSLPRTTVFYWVRDLPIPGSGPGGGWPESARRKGSRAMQAKYRGLREAAYAEGRSQFEQLAQNPTFRDVICLYIGEGYKRSRNEVALCNSDPSVIRISDRWIKRFARTPLRYSVQFHADQDPAELTKFWGIQVEAAPSAIRLQRKSNSNRLTGRNWRSRYGVFTVSAGDTILRAMLEAWMDCIRESWV